jgi:hypothetical protein
LLRFEKPSYAKHALAYQINWEIYTPSAGESGTCTCMLLHRKGKMAIAKSKSSRLSYSEFAWAIRMVSHEICILFPNQKKFGFPGAIFV